MSRTYSTAKLDILWQRYGRLTVIAPVENIDRRTAWLCRCDCGNEIVVKTVHLRAGKVKSCGCSKNAHSVNALGLHYVDGTCVEILRKNPVRSNNSSGVTGVCWCKSKRRWRASICFKGKRYWLGTYERFADAVSARKKAEEETHGAFLAYIDSLSEQ